jgi:hypothetical protein
MTSPPRLVGRGGLTRSIIESAKGDQPSREGRERARAAGLAALGAGAATSAALLAGAAKATGKTTAIAVAKWALLAAIPVSVATTSYVVVQGTKSRSTSRALATAEPSLVASTASVASSSPVAELPSLAPEPGSTVAPAPQPVRRAASLEEQITELDAARHALARGDTSILDRYLASNPHGALREQALWLKIKSLEETGRHDQAKVRARELLSSYPRSPNAEAARRILER